ncbi:dienelactone hydrolase family protein [Sunxiuqinia sp. A32]|uniref:dienelactone hydrolase family protein n=1 Tax=Sunxiuqinia sp. A32 TaxID=3461496 RepID=UPI0040465A81
MKKYLLAIVFVVYIQAVFAQDYALNQLEKSPRHHEWVKVKAGEREVSCFIAFPEISGKATVVIVIHENRGLTDWVRSFADQIAQAGYIAIAPDLLSDFSEAHQKTSDFPTSDEARNAIYQLNADQVKNDLNAVQAYATNIKASNGKTVSIGFCWGGSQSFQFATYNNQLKAAMVFYGSAPDDESQIAEINAPVYGFYGGDDARINAGIADTEESMKKFGKFYEYEIYEGAGHAYMRRGDDPADESPNKTARNESWVRLKRILEGI